jgi:hypothetical protein
LVSMAVVPMRDPHHILRRSLELVGGVSDASTKEFVAILAWRRTVRQSPVRIASDIDD